MPYSNYQLYFVENDRFDLLERDHETNHNEQTRPTLRNNYVFCFPKIYISLVYRHALK